jgi:hypothetical protein
VVLDHARVNYVAAELSIAVRSTDMTRLLNSLMLDGAVPVLLLLGGLVAAIAAEIWILRSVARRDGLFRPISLRSALGQIGSGGLASLRRLQAAREYVRARRAVHYAIWAWRPLVPARLMALGAMLYGLGLRAGVELSAPDIETGEAGPRPTAVTSPS